VALVFFPHFCWSGAGGGVSGWGGFSCGFGGFGAGGFGGVLLLLGFGWGGRGWASSFLVFLGRRTTAVLSAFQSPPKPSLFAVIGLFL